MTGACLKKRLEKVETDVDGFENVLSRIYNKKLNVENKFRMNDGQN